jgi:hypothetical protein
MAQATIDTASHATSSSKPQAVRASAIGSIWMAITSGPAAVTSGPAAVVICSAQIAIGQTHA